MLRFKPFLLIFLFLSAGLLWGTECLAGVDAESIVNVFKYMRAIHIMVMLLVGFGFLMVCVKNYGRSALTATYLLVAISLPLYLLKDYFGIMCNTQNMVDQLILAEFAAASLLICAGAVLGRLRMYQYLFLGLLFVPAYAFNEWLLLDGGLGLLAPGAVTDTGGSIVIHAFGAFFGLGAIMPLTLAKHSQHPVEADCLSDRFSLLGSMALWVFWPSFCAGLVPLAQVPLTITNVIVALCGSTLITYFATIILRKNISAADIANATLAGGVAIGSACNLTDPGTAFIIGAVAGALSTFGFAVLQGRFQSFIKKVDTCGVMYLHGLPGLLGGLAAIFAVEGVQPGSQMLGMAITVAVAVVCGLAGGWFISLTGQRNRPYDDEEEFD